MQLQGNYISIDLMVVPILLIEKWKHENENNISAIIDDVSKKDFYIGCIMHAFVSRWFPDQTNSNKHAGSQLIVCFS
jgi:hypothetical protein